MRYCKAHPDYEAKRRPRVECFSCWRLYLEEKGTTLEAYAAATDKQDKDTAKWLRTNIDDIIYAGLEYNEAEKVEIVASKLEFVAPEVWPNVTSSGGGGNPPPKAAPKVEGPAKGTLV